MKVFITSSFEGSTNKKEIENLCKIVRNAGFEDFHFIRDIEHYRKTFRDPKELMKRSKEEIGKCDALLFDATRKSTGQDLEVGIGYSLGKKIIIIAKEGVEIKDTLRGVADTIITYKQISDTAKELKNYLLSYEK